VRAHNENRFCRVFHSRFLILDKLPDWSPPWSIPPLPRTRFASL
jgi:hypothetical protein